MFEDALRKAMKSQCFAPDSLYVRTARIGDAHRRFAELSRSDPGIQLCAILLDLRDRVHSGYENCSMTAFTHIQWKSLHTNSCRIRSCPVKLLPSLLEGSF